MLYRVMLYFLVITRLNLSWAVWFQVVNPVLRPDIANLVDPALQGQCSTNRLYNTFLLAARCASELPTVRPAIAEVVSTLNIISKPTRRRRLERGEPSTPTGNSSGGNQAQVQDLEEGS